MSNSLYSVAAETTTRLNKFRISSGRAKGLEALIYEIDTKKETSSSYEIKLQECDTTNDKGVITDKDDLIEELPDNSPRFVVLTYPFKTSDGLLKSPLVLVYWRPSTSSMEKRMLYAGAVELMRDKAAVSKVIEIDDEDELEELEELVKKA
ncbi:unnamed protein product [[Candida] boidinii]|uniref:Unnamed protein product n=1 Tax=Candida boidinii TaxID=5477 RepID=A0ACB5TSE5_CANBO|nr:unnamed protein product [[Candida] boidinii]